MFGVENEGGVERAGVDLIGSLACDHVEKIRRVPESPAGIERFQARCEAVLGRDDGGNLRGEPERFSAVRLRRGVFRLGVEKPEDSHAASERSRPLLAGGYLLESAQHSGRESAFGLERLVEPLQAFAGGQFAVPQKINDFLEGDFLAHHFRHVVPAIRQNAVHAVQIAYPRIGGDDALQASDGCIFHEDSPLWRALVV